MNVSAIIELKEGEKVLGVVRNHWIVQMPKAALAFLLISAPFFFALPLFKLAGWGYAAFGFSVFAGLLYGARVAYVWYWNAFVITTRRVIDVDQRGFLSRTVSEATFDKIQDVSYAVKGLWGTIFRFGTIDLQTAGASANLELPRVHDPKAVHHLITETMSSHRAFAGGGARNEKAASLLEAASALDDAEARAFLTAIQAAVRDKGGTNGKKED